MGNFTRRGAAALLAAGAMVVTPLATANASDIDETIDIDGPVEIAVEKGPDIWRMASYDRVATSIEAAERSDSMWGAGYDVPDMYAGAKVAILASTQSFTDSLAAAPLADELNAPIILNGPGGLDGRVKAHLLSHGYDAVILAGGSDVLPASVVNELNAAGLFADRAAGANRYQTAIALAGNAIWVDSYNEVPSLNNANVFLASGQDFADALAAGPAAAAHSGVVLLTKGSEGLDSQTFEALTNWTNPDFDFDTPWGPTNHAMTIAIGGPAVAGAAAGWLADPVQVHESVVGANRYETAVLTAEAYVPHSSGNYVIASGQNFPDAVVGGAYAANVDGPLLLTQENNLPKVVRDYFAVNGVREQVENIIVFGGTNSVSMTVSQQVANLPWNY